MSFLVATAACGGDEAPAPGVSTTAAAGGSSATTSSTGSGGSSTSSGVGGAGGGTGGARAGSLETDYCAPLAKLICERAAGCGCGVLVQGGAVDLAACTTSFEARCALAYADVASALSTGEARVDAVAAAACIDLITTSTPDCERPSGAVAQGLCPPWFSSDAALGAPCSFPICADGAGFCPAGTCVSRPEAGAPCTGLECKPGTLCIEGICAAPAAAGAPCAMDPACEPSLHCVAGACAALAPKKGACSTSDACAQALVCDANQCATPAPGPCQDASACGNLALCAVKRTCEQPGSAGSPCLVDEACTAGSGCEPGAKKCTLYPGVGEPCQNGTLCAPGLACTTDSGSCAPIPAAGEPCGFGPLGPFVCEAGLGCVDGLCGALPTGGQACTTDSRCADGFGCDFQPGGSVCIVPKTAGQACQNDQACAVGLHCNYEAGTCALAAPIGGPCKDGNECGAAGACLFGPGGQLACAPMPGLGEECLFDCEPGLACLVDPAQASCVPAICVDLLSSF